MLDCAFLKIEGLMLCDPPDTSSSFCVAKDGELVRPASRHRNVGRHDMQRTDRYHNMEDEWNVQCVLVDTRCRRIMSLSKC